MALTWGSLKIQANPEALLGLPEHDLMFQPKIELIVPPMESKDKDVYNIKQKLQKARSIAATILVQMQLQLQ